MRVQILSGVPTGSPGITKVDTIPSMIACNGHNGLTAFLVGNGIVDLYTWQDSHWRIFPSGSDITDDDSLTRLVIGDDQMYACLVAQSGTDENTEGYLAASSRR